MTPPPSSSQTSLKSYELKLPVQREFGINEMRKQFENEIVKHPNDFHPIDIERVRTNDWQTLRFLHRSETVQKAFNRLIETLRWKMMNQLHEINDEDFAREFYQINSIELTGRNSTNQLVVWSTSKYCRDFSELKPHIMKFVIHEIEFLDRQSLDNGIILINDCKYVGLLSIDIDITRYANEIVMKHYPCMIRQNIVINLSMLLDPFYRIILTFMDDEIRDKTKVLNLKNLDQYLDAEFIPVEYGGKRSVHDVRIPNNTKSYMEMPELNLTDAQLKRYKSILSRLQ
ncbi:hypothetical protein RDWZM_002302 [Blomia tropicalis]|uniref:CRAL-TRIO domain-containing protein n=1 Tax=Blomia tropicalis TaxID=40697 RepID=A0A9Q0MG49_BLOTA|nr:hypothetical protein RDWZM_002302 [Blomia tropicalis]